MRIMSYTFRGGALVWTAGGIEPGCFGGIEATAIMQHDGLVDYNLDVKS